MHCIAIWSGVLALPAITWLQEPVRTFRWSLQRLQNSRGSSPQHYMTEGACPDLQNSRRSITGSSYIIEKHDCGLYRYDYAKESAALYALEKELSLESSAKLLADADATELFEDLKVKAKEIEDQTCISPKSMKRVLKITR